MNITRIQNSPETYAITESRTVRASARWTSSGTRSGECVSIFPDGTKIPFTPTRPERSHATRRRTQNLRAAQRRHLMEIATTKGHIETMAE